MVGIGKYHPEALPARAAGRGRACPLCRAPVDRFGACGAGHAEVRAIGTTWSFRDFRDNLIVDVDAPVLAWRQDKGHRLGCENSHETVAWNLFRGLEVLGAAAAGLATEGPVDLFFWGRHRDATPWAPLADARAALEEHIHGPDVNSAEPDLIVVDGGRRTVTFLDAHLAAPLCALRPPRWFAGAGTPAGFRRRRAILDGLLREEEGPHPFRRGLDEAIRRGFYAPARQEQPRSSAWSTR